MIWLLAAAAVLTAAAAATCWWGSGMLLHPYRMSPLKTGPDRFGFQYEKAEFRTSDGLLLKGWLIPAAEPTARTLLLCHGWSDNKGDLLERTHFLRESFNLFYFDFRQHGESEGSFSSVGFLESRDVSAALDFLARARPAWTSRLGAFGLSMGAGVAIWAAARRPEVKAVAVEAPFASFNDVVRRWISNEFHLPYLPLCWFTLLILRFRLGEDPEPYSPIHHVRGISPRPLLAIAAGRDKIMPLEAAREVHRAAGEPKELWVVPEARHGRCEETAGAEYHRRLLEFFRKHL